jgi:hypothetical protein
MDCAQTFGRWLKSELAASRGMIWIYVQATNQFILGGETQRRLGLEDNIVPEAVGWALIHAADHARVMTALEQLDAGAEAVELSKARVLEAPDLYGTHDLGLVPVSCCRAFGDCHVSGPVLGPCRAVVFSAREESVSPRPSTVMPIPEALPLVDRPDRKPALAPVEPHPRLGEQDGKELFRRLEAVREIAGEYWKYGRQSRKLNLL